MTDVFTRTKRSEVMAAIRATNTKPEIIVRRMLHLMGYRFRLHDSSLPGRPDIVMRKVQTVIQVKGCFWHGHHCLQGRVPGANRPYWRAKIAGNRKRDKRNERRLRALGWRVKTIWECSIRKSSPAALYGRLKKIMLMAGPVAKWPDKGNENERSTVEAALEAGRTRRRRGAGTPIRKGEGREGDGMLRVGAGTHG